PALDVPPTQAAIPSSTAHAAACTTRICRRDNPANQIFIKKSSLRGPLASARCLAVFPRSHIDKLPRYCRQPYDSYPDPPAALTGRLPVTTITKKRDSSPRRPCRLRLPIEKQHGLFAARSPAHAEKRQCPPAEMR